MSSLFLAAFLALSPAPAAQAAPVGTPFDGCGTIVMGVTCPRLFSPDAGGGYWLLDDFGTFQVNERVRVVGTLDPFCFTTCQQGGCIHNNTIGPCDVCNCTPSCDGSGTFGPCPCNNQGGPGRGCPNSINPLGALLTATGNSALANDTVVLHGSGMPNGPLLYFQAETSIAVPLAFGDGMRCAAAPFVRLKITTNVGGASQFPAAGDPQLSVRGQVLAPGTREYQTWYRNGANFCSPATFNLSNGIVVAWSA